MKRLVLNENANREMLTLQNGLVFTKKGEESKTKLPCNPTLDETDLSKNFELRRLMEQRIILVESYDESDAQENTEEEDMIIKEQKTRENDKQTQEALEKLKEQEDDEDEESSDAEELEALEQEE